MDCCHKIQVQVRSSIDADDVQDRSSIDADDVQDRSSIDELTMFRTGLVYVK